MQNRNNLPKKPFNIPKPELKIPTHTLKSISTKPGTSSHITNEKINSAYRKPKGQINVNRDYQSKYHSQILKPNARVPAQFHNSYSNDQVDQVGIHNNHDHLRYQMKKNEKVIRPLPRISPQQHKVIDILPKPPAAGVEWRVPDQTLGIPVINPSSSMNHLHTMIAPRPTFNYGMQPPSKMPPHHPHSMMGYHSKSIPLAKSKSLHNITNNMAHVIHQHPLISGHIPPTTQFMDNYTLKRNATASNMAGIHKLNLPPKNNATSILSPPSTQPNVSPKKDHSEKNKVKFSDTVTVAVVPVSLL